MFRHASAFCFESDTKNDNFTFVWHNLVIRPVKLVSIQSRVFH